MVTYFGFSAIYRTLSANHLPHNRRCEPASWCALLKSLSPKIPVQLHIEPFEMTDSEAPPLFHRCVKMLKTKPELDDQMAAQKARLKIRLSAKGKFIHRNRYRRRNIICCLHGEQKWLLVETLVKDKNGDLIADKLLNSTSNGNWNGFRSNLYPVGCFACTYWYASRFG